MVVSVKNPIVSILLLIVCFFNAAGLFILLDAEYLAFSLIVVYVGAVAVLFLFVVMLLPIGEKFKNVQKKYRNIYVALGLLILFELFLLFSTKNTCCVHDDLSIFSMSAIKADSNIHALGQLLYTHYFLAFELSGLVLFVAMIGAVILIHRKTNFGKKQNVRTQLFRSKKETLEIVKVVPSTKREKNE